MSALPRVGSLTRERVAREFDDRGPEVCRTEIIHELDADNPEVLDMARRCARDVGEFSRIMTGFCMFYRLLSAEAQAAVGTSRELRDSQTDSPLRSLVPRVSAGTRELIVRRIDSVGSRDFTRETIAEVERNNPELLMMWHNFAENQSDYGGVIQGFALLYACLAAEAAQTRGALH